MKIIKATSVETGTTIHDNNKMKNFNFLNVLLLHRYI